MTGDNLVKRVSGINGNSFSLREVPAGSALKDYQKHLDAAKRKISNMESAPKIEIPGTKTINLIPRNQERKELTKEEAESLAKLLLTNKDISKTTIVESLEDSLSFTNRRITEHFSRTSSGISQKPELDEQKEQFLKGEKVRKETLLQNIKLSFQKKAAPKKEIIEELGKELQSQSRVQAYGEKHRDLGLTNALAFKHTCEQCMGYLRMLGNEPVKQFLGRDGKMWICPTEQLRDQALFKQYQHGKSKDLSLER